LVCGRPILSGSINVPTLFFNPRSAPDDFEFRVGWRPMSISSNPLSKTNGGYIVVKCAFQIISKSPQVAIELAGIAHQIRARMPDFSQEMTAAMGE
jgi:hypothetical protein